MAILPERILTPQQVNLFVRECNECQKRLTGQPLFQIPEVELPGIGLLIDLQIQTLERSLASAFAPIFLGKKIITEARESPARFFSIVGDGLASIRQLFSDPLQFVLDEGINKVLEQFPFPIRFIIDSSVSGINTDNLISLLNNVSVSTGSSGISFNYEILFSTSQIPLQGEISTPANSLNGTTLIRINNTPKVGEGLAPVNDLEIGEEFTIFTPENDVTFRVNSKVDKNFYFDIGVQRLSSSSNINQNENKIFAPGFSTGLSISQDISLRRFLRSDGRILLPFSIFGVNFIGFNKLAIEIGNFGSLQSNSRIKQFVDKLGIEADLNFQEVLSDMVNGIFPEINYDKLRAGDAKERAKEKMVGLARLIQLGISKPLFLIKIILAYLKLLLLPLKIVFGVLKGLAERITSPVSLIRTVIQGISNPLRLICELISIGVLEFLDPYLRPIITPIIPYQEAVIDPIDSSRGIRPLISDLVCGSFFKKLRDYSPNNSFFQQQNRLLIEDQEPIQFGPNLPYFIVVDLGEPLSGEIYLNSENSSEVRVLKVSTLSNTVEDSTPFLANVNVGETIRLVINDTVVTYRINSSFFKISTSGNYYEFLVQPISVIEGPNTGQPNPNIQQNLRIPTQGLSSLLNINNPNKEFLFIVERYLPLKLITAWQSIKGILSLIICLVARIPTLLTAVVKSLFGREQDLSINDENPSPQNVEDLVESSGDVLRILYGGQNPVMNQITITGPAGSSRQDFIDLAIGIIGNSENSTDGIEQLFYSLRENTLARNGTFQVLRSDLPANLQSSFYWGALDLNDLGNIVKILTVADFELRDLPVFFNGAPYIASGQPIPKVFVNVNGESREIFSGGQLIDVLYSYRIFTDLPGVNGDLVTTQDARNLISLQLAFVYLRLLPTLLISSNTNQSSTLPAAPPTPPPTQPAATTPSRFQPIGREGFFQGEEVTAANGFSYRWVTTEGGRWVIQS
jgi:hypothetical protein